MRAAARAQSGSNTPWVPLGPAPLESDQNLYGTVAGRATAVAIDPTDATGNTVYVAAAAGGVWKSTNAISTPATNVTWTALTDQQASLVNGAMSVKPDGSVVLVGTGEPDSAIDSYYGIGVLRSTDHGASWTLIPSANGGTNSFAGLGVAKFAWGAATTVIAATGTTAKGFDEGAITDGTNRGLYYSNDSGQTWGFQVPQDGGVAISPASISATDVVYNATAGKFFTVIRYHGVYSSTNGQGWARLVNQPNPAGLSVANCPAQIPGGGSSCPLYRGQMAVVPGRNETYFWSVSLANGGADVIDEGIWRSTDGGNTWAQIDETGIANCGDPGNYGCGVEQGYYNLEIAALPDGQATDVYAGAVNLFKCKLTNGGTTCATIDANYPNQWINLTHVYGCSSIAGVHPDEHGLDFIVAGGKQVMYFANDGGIYRTLDGLTELDSGTCGVANGFDDLNESSVANGTIGSLTQFVSFSLHPTDENTVLGGTQDNGSAATSAATSNMEWVTVNGGDGGFNAIDPTTPTNWYTANTYVNIFACAGGINCTTDTFALTVGNDEVGGDTGPFYTPYILDPKNSTAMLVGTCRVWRGMPTVPPSSFTAISVDFDTLAPATCTGEEINLVSGLAEGGPTAGGLSTAVYATTEGTGPNATQPSGGEVWVTTNAGVTAMEPVTGNINPQNYTISSVAVDTSDGTGATAYVAIMGFLGSGTHIWKTTNAGTNWSAFGSVANGLPDAPVNALLVDGQAGVIYAGTDVGVFASSTAGPSWTEVGTPPMPGGAAGYLPNVPVTAIRMFSLNGTKKLRVSTYGRGIWEYALALAPDYSNVISNTPQKIYPSQTAVFNGTLTSLNGYASQVNLSCTGTPPATCTLSPKHAVPTATYTLTAGGSVGDYSFNAHAVGTDPQAIVHDAAVVLHVIDFNLTAPNPNSLTVGQGQTSNASTFAVTAGGSFSGTVNLSCPSGLPSGAACVFSPSNAVNPTAANPVTVTLTVAAAPNTTVGGPSTVTLAGTVAGAPAAKTQTFSLTVTAAAPDFSLSVNETPGATVAGENITWNGTLTAINGYNSVVNLSCMGATPATCTVNPGSLVPTAGGAAFAVTVGNPTATSSAFSFSIQGTDGAQTHSQAASLTVGTDVTWTDTGSNSATVEAGQAATYTFSAAPAGAGSFSGAVSFSCLNLPPLAACAFSPAAIAAGAGVTTVTLTISTAPPGQSRRGGGGRHGSGSGDGTSPGNKLAELTLCLTLPMAVLPLGGRRRFSRTRALPAGGAVLLWLALLASCGGLGGGGGGQQVTVSVNPPAIAVPLGGQQQFTAVVNGGDNPSVTWAVTGGSANGTIDASGLYTAPGSAPNPASATVTAISPLGGQPGTARVNFETGSGIYANIMVTAVAANGPPHTDLVNLTVN